jgi:hypothetical protein
MRMRGLAVNHLAGIVTGMDLAILLLLASKG